MFARLALLAIAFALLEGLAAASCTPGYAGSGYYRTSDCGLRLGPRAVSSFGHTYGYGYGIGYGYTLDALIPTLYGPPLSYGYPGSAPYVPNWYAAPFLTPSHSFTYPAPGFHYSPRSPTRMRPQRRSSNVLPGTIRPGLREGFADRFVARTPSRSQRKMARLSNGVWVNE